MQKSERAYKSKTTDKRTPRIIKTMNSGRAILSLITAWLVINDHHLKSIEIR